MPVGNPQAGAGGLQGLTPQLLQFLAAQGGRNSRIDAKRRAEQGEIDHSGREAGAWGAASQGFDSLYNTGVNAAMMAAGMPGGGPTSLLSLLGAGGGGAAAAPAPSLTPPAGGGLQYGGQPSPAVGGGTTGYRPPRPGYGMGTPSLYGGQP